MRPTSLDRFRVTSPRPAYEANAHNVDENSVDCGIQVLKCCDTPRWRQMGTTKTFLTVLILLAIVQGICEKFISISANQAALEHDYNPDIIEWLLVSNGIIQGIFSIFIAYWGNRIHKITWLCGMVVFQSITCLLIIFPTLAHNDSTATSSMVNIHSVELKCTNSIELTANLSIEPVPQAITTLIGLFLLQIGISYGFIAFYTLGLTYLDDNAIEHNSPALIGAALAGRYMGFLYGNLLASFTYGVSLGWWLGWAIISPILLIIAIFIGLYPRRMIQSLIRQAADAIVETATNSSQLSLSRTKFLSDISFFSSISRLFRNKILLLNIFATVFIQTALINFTLQQDNYLQSRFLMPADGSNVLNNEWTSRTLSKLIQPIVVGLAILIGGLIIAKATPSPRKIVAWNLITALIVCLLFVGFIFIECSHNAIAGAYGKRLVLPYCSRSCVCDSDIRFTPVCPENSEKTFFSPCHAGCVTEQEVNGQRVFGNCSCGTDPDVNLINEGVTVATEGACGYENCQKMWIIFQILVVFGTVCIGSRFVGKILITIRSVLSQDTAIALALELTFVGLMAYIPGKLAYEYIADITCQYWSQNNLLCYLHNSQDFGNIINILSAILSLVAVIFEFILLFFVNDLQLYGTEVEPQLTGVELQPISSERNETDVESHEPLLTHRENAEEPVSSQSQLPHISAPISITSTSQSSTAVGMVTQVKQSLSNRFVMSAQSKASTVRYSPVYKNTTESHIEELNSRLKTLNERTCSSFSDNDALGAQATLVPDINPSVGSDNEKDPEVNIRQLESSVSSLSGLPSGSSAINSPEIVRNRVVKLDENWHVERYETDF
ncbi:solute carrier organic anion transporter family member 74D isoform X2 [Contarinia nasturtii]|uniref:solute carrier organic anion transporter family member 74D isoform X2 n=1 Tax=Contarinia nasturtii TaxID=265458 RepID=UPI0012D44B26|nr:solute carrier organic anion transporter family member 74D isoform X2 [Contarinia nasturtii]